MILTYNLNFSNILTIPYKKGRFSTKSKAEKIPSSVPATNTEIITEGSPQSQDTVERFLDTSNTDITVRLDNLEERFNSLFENLPQTPSITALDYQQQKKQLDDLMEIISGDKTSFMDSDFGKILKGNVTEIMRMIQHEKGISKSLPFSTDSIFLDVKDFETINMSSENSTLILNYINGIKTLTTTSVNNLVDVSQPVTVFLIKHIYINNQYFKKFVENNFESFSTEIEGSPITINYNSFQNLFTYVGQSFGHQSLSSVCNILICYTTGLEVPTEFCIASVNDVEAIKTTYAKNALDIGEDHQKNIDEITEELNYKTSSLSKVLTLANKHPYLTMMSLITTSFFSLKYFQPELFQQTLSTLAKYPYLTDICNALGFDNANLTEGSTASANTSSNKEVSTVGKVTATTFGARLLYFCDKNYADFRAFFVKYFGDDYR